LVDLYSAYPALPGGSRRWEQSLLPGWNSRQATTMGAHVLLPLAGISGNENVIRALWLTATVGDRTCDLRHSSAPPRPLGQVPPTIDIIRTKRPSSTYNTAEELSTIYTSTCTSTVHVCVSSSGDFPYFEQSYNVNVCYLALCPNCSIFDWLIEWLIDWLNTCIAHTSVLSNAHGASKADVLTCSQKVSHPEMAIREWNDHFYLRNKQSFLQ
jgi:hypothetical protein